MDADCDVLGSSDAFRLQFGKMRVNVASALYDRVSIMSDRFLYESRRAIICFTDVPYYEE